MLLSLSAAFIVHAAAVDAALAVCVQTGEAEAELVKSYTASELAALKESRTEGYSYVYWKGEDMKAVVATEYMTLDALLADAGTTFGAGEALQFTCSDGPYSKGDFSYETMAERGYDANSNAVPTAFALTWGNTLEAQENTGSIRFVCGATVTELEGHKAAGNRMPSGVVAVTVVKPGAAFTDVAEDAYYYDAVLWAVKNGVTTGTYETTFSPGNTCTRAEAVTFLWRAAGSPEPAGAADPFMDVKESDYFYKAVLWAAEQKITSGTSETTFAPDQTCTRGEIVTFLWRASGSVKPASTENPFRDVEDGAYYSDAVLWAAEQKITSGTSETTFAPDQTCTRGEIVTFLYRSVQRNSD